VDQTLLVLDLDETLIFSSEEPLDRSEDFRVGDYYTYKRPGLEAFLDFAFRHFDVAVWTSAEEHYARRAIESLFPVTARLKFMWVRDRCTLKSDYETRQTYWVKDLKKVKRAGFSLDQVIVIDDSPEMLERNYGNHVRVEPFYGSDTDSELFQLQEFLLTLKGVPDVRVVEKRGWKRRLSASEP
jgi:RNA polymerase II subunit A small phosphatase-like protein